MSKYIYIRRNVTKLPLPRGTGPQGTIWVQIDKQTLGVQMTTYTKIKEITNADTCLSKSPGSFTPQVAKIK